jgi:hypothetical protein
MLTSFDIHATGMPIVDAQSDFRRARRRQATARATRWLAGRRRRCGGVTTLPSTALPFGAPRLKVVPLRSIVGVVEPTPHFDCDFRPASEHVRARWERVALAHRKGLPLPPIRLVQGAEGYYVVDGRHRVSVALALGRRDIDAWVTAAR